MTAPATKVIVYTQADGTVATTSIGWINPPPVQDVDGALAAAPAGAIVVDEADLPDRRATDAWVLSAGGTLSVDLDKVRERRSALARADGVAALEAHDRFVRLGLYGAGAAGDQAAAAAEAMVRTKMEERLARIAAAATVDALLEL